MQETGRDVYDPVIYIPETDVPGPLEPVAGKSTHCPLKGDASYWSIASGGATAVNAVWAYEKPYDEVAEITGALAFYASKVDAIEFDAN